MKINYEKGKYTYYDMNGVELHEDDIVFVNGKNMRVFLTDQDRLGTDATNPAWLRSGRAVEGENGIYPFQWHDEPVLVAPAGTYHSWDCIAGTFVKKEVIEQ